MNKVKQKIALVLSGGGTRGITHIGVIQELLKRDNQINLVAGSSMGTLVGGDEGDLLVAVYVNADVLTVKLEKSKQDEKEKNQFISKESRDFMSI